MPGGVANPVRQRGTIQIDTVAGIDLGLPVQRQVIGIFGHQNLGDRGLGRQAALDQSRWRRGLHDTVLASPAGVFGPPGDEHPELRRHDVEPLALVLADPVQLAFATGTGLVIDVDDDRDPRQMRGQRSTVDPALATPRCAAIGCVLTLLGFVRCFDLLDLFQTQQHLLLRQRLCPAAKAMPLQLLDDLTQPFALAPLGEQHRFQRLEIIRQGVVRHDQIRSYSAECCDDL
jgi:hypothetical protein